MKWWDRMPWSSFSECWALSQLFHSPLSLKTMALCVCMYVWMRLAQSCPTVCDPTDCSPPGSPVHGILQAKILEWVTISFSSRSSKTQGSNPDGFPSCTEGILFTIWATREALCVCVCVCVCVWTAWYSYIPVCVCVCVYVCVSSMIFLRSYKESRGLGVFFAL